MSDLAARIRDYVEAAAAPVTAEEAIGRSRGRERGAAPAPRSPVVVAAIAAAAALLLVGGGVVAWRLLTLGDDGGPATTVPATTSTAPPVSTTATTTTTTAAETTTTGGALEPDLPPADVMPDPIRVDAAVIVGDLAAPEGWTVEPCGGGVLCIADGGACDPPEEGETCNTIAPGAVHLDVYAADEVPGWAGHLAASGAAGPEDGAAVREALRGWVADYYGWIAGIWEHWKWEFDPYAPVPAEVGALPGVHFGYGGRDGAETSQHMDGYVAYDGLYLYVITVRGPEIAPDAEATGGIEAFAPYLERIVAGLRLPLSQEPISPPPVNPGWTLEPGDVLVAGTEGVAILRGAPGGREVAGTITDVPVMQAYHDRMGGIVLQQAHPRDTPQVQPTQSAIWWVPGSGAGPVALHQPGPGERTTLYGVAVLGGPAALYSIEEPGEHFGQEVLVAHDLRSGEVRRVTVASAGEVQARCVSWGPAGMLLTVEAETNLWFDLVDVRGDPAEPVPALEALESEDNPYASVCAAQREADGMIAVALRSWEEPGELVIIDPAAGAEVRRIAIDTALVEEMNDAEMLPDVWFDTRVDFLGDRVLVSNLIRGLPAQFVVYLGDGGIEMLPVEGTASLVR